MTNKEEIFDLIAQHPEGLDDDAIAEMTGIQPRQQVQQLCNQLADSQRINRHSVEKAGKRRKIHNFPRGEANEGLPSPSSDLRPEKWRRRLAALVAATGRTEEDLIDDSLRLLAMKVLRQNDEGVPPSESQET